MMLLWLPLVLATVIWAEEQYFLQSKNTTWDEARLHCQVCYKELTTITSRNVHLVVQNLTSDYWIGLRRRFNGSVPWSRWSNGDPMTYQNWIPGHPIPKEKPPACSSTSTPMTPAGTIMSPTAAPQNNNTEVLCPLLFEILTCLNMTLDEFDNKTRPVVSATPHSLYSSPLPVNVTPNSTKSTCDPDPDLDPAEYIDDACVSLLSFGLWREKQCYEQLPFICYDERFFGQINISNVSESGGFLQWSQGPAGNISHYRVEVTGDTRQTFNETDLSTNVEKLTAGTRYSVQVFPVKCGRDLNPQNVSFYTLPLGIENLLIDSVTNDSVRLSWSHSGNCDFFLVRVSGKPLTSQPYTNITVEKLQPGTNYTFTVSAVVNQTTESVSSSVSAFTKPSIVLDLKSESTERTVIKASWNPPNGGHSGYRYCLNEESECINCTGCNCTEMVNGSNAIQQIELQDKTPGAKYFLCVAALTNNNMEAGQMVQTKAFTRPNAVKLSLSTSDQYIDAIWTLDGRFYNFSVSIEPSVKSSQFTRDFNHTFEGLKAAVYYTVRVITYAENGLSSEAAVLSEYTKPTEPQRAEAIALNTTAINLTWAVPEKSKGASNITYEVAYHSPYWGKNDTKNVTTDNYVFANLTPGTTYNFTVTVVAGHLKSNPASHYAETVPNKRTLTFAMLCSSDQPLYCNDTTWNITVNELKLLFGQQFKGVHWALRKIVRN